MGRISYMYKIFTVQIRSPNMTVTIFHVPQRKSGQWTFFYTNPQSLELTLFIRWLKTLEASVNFDWLSVQTFQLLILICRSGNFVYHHWGSTSIYQPLSYPFKSLLFLTIIPILWWGKVPLKRIPTSGISGLS